MWFFNEEELLLLHYKLIERFGGSHGVRDLKRLKSSLTAPKTTHYKTPTLKAAVYARNIICDHPFNDGNKRTGIMSALIFLDKNGMKLKLQKKELEDFAIQIAIDKPRVEEIAEWFKDRLQHATSLDWK